MEQKSFLRYLIELLIVIVGVTIAFWLNTRAEAAKEQKVLNNYYSELRSDLETDRKILERTISSNENKLNKMVQAMGLYQTGEPARDSVLAYSQQIGNYYFFDPKDITYRSMISSGDLKLINNLSLKRKLVSLYDRYETIDMLQQNHLQALDNNYFPKYVYMVDYLSGEVLEPIEKDILVKNYFAFSANELSTHLAFYNVALKQNQELDSLIIATAR